MTDAPQKRGPAQGAYSEGVRAARREALKKRVCCPYLAGSSDHAEWFRGYRDEKWSLDRQR